MQAILLDVYSWVSKFESLWHIFNQRVAQFVVVATKQYHSCQVALLSLGCTYPSFLIEDFPDPVQHSMTGCHPLLLVNWPLNAQALHSAQKQHVQRQIQRQIQRHAELLTKCV